ncbi:NAD(P)-dependent oxidoreductase [Desulfovibrio sp.]|uniref:NAD-dependent epimerase/dehydratase family protein n=1 Tax=Desulfovibrio sp. TaxID=885 RepID=UPI0025BBD37E|nr:NAD(P)-dependent oxidoreductase [Desulfovibrio sp.]
MKILIAGGAGYIGSVLVPLLQERGYHVTVLDFEWFGNHLPSNIPVLKQDVLSITHETLVGFDAAIFLAGLSNDPMAEYSPAQNFVYNAAHPAYLAFMAKRAGVKRFIHGGSCSVYGYTVNELYDEESPAISNYPYGISKLQGEYGCLKLTSTDFSVIAFRQGTVCGYSPRMRLDLVINAMFRSAVQDKKIIVNNPAIWRPILSVRDAATAYIRALESPQEISGIFNIASGNYTVGEIADYVYAGMQEHMGIKASIEVRNVQDFRNYKVSCAKATNLLSFKARFNAADIVQDLAKNYEHFKDFDNPCYYNIRTFESLTKEGKC